MNWRKNVLVLAGMSCIVAAAATALLFAGALPLEVMLLLVGIMSTAGGGTLVLAGQVAQNDPPNPHKDELDHQYRMAQLEVQLAK